MPPAARGSKTSKARSGLGRSGGCILGHLSAFWAARGSAPRRVSGRCWEGWGIQAPSSSGLLPNISAKNIEGTLSQPLYR